MSQCPTEKFARGFSGSILTQFPNDLASYKQTKCALHVLIGKPLSKALLRRLLRARAADFPAKGTPGQLTAPTMVAALRLVREGADEPGGYTERVLTDIRRTVKGSQTS